MAEEEVIIQSADETTTIDYMKETTDLLNNQSDIHQKNMNDISEQLDVIQDTIINTNINANIDTSIVDNIADNIDTSVIEAHTEDILTLILEIKNDIKEIKNKLEM